MLEHIIKFCNVNDGFIMGLLTLVYVGATILICKYNYKSLKQVERQIEVGNLLQKQNVDMQLFELRKKLVFELKEELVIKVQYFTEQLFGNGSEEKYEEKVIVLLDELLYLFEREDFEFVYQANNCMNEIQKCLMEYSRKYSEFVFLYYKDEYEDKLEKFKDSTKDFLNNTIDEKSYKNISETIRAEDMCVCMIKAKQKYLEALELLNKNDIENVFKNKYLSFK